MYNCDESLSDVESEQGERRNIVDIPGSGSPPISQKFIYLKISGGRIIDDMRPIETNNHPYVDIVELFGDGDVIPEASAISSRSRSSASETRGEPMISDGNTNGQTCEIASQEEMIGPSAVNVATFSGSFDLVDILAGSTCRSNRGPVYTMVEGCPTSSSGGCIVEDSRLVNCRVSPGGSFGSSRTGEVVASGSADQSSYSFSEKGSSLLDDLFSILSSSPEGALFFTSLPTIPTVSSSVLPTSSQYDLSQPELSSSMPERGVRASKKRCGTGGTGQMDEAKRLKMARSNQRERERVRNLSEGFEKLRSVLPRLKFRQNVSHCEILTEASTYLAQLTNIIQHISPSISLDSESPSLSYESSSSADMMMETAATPLESPLKLMMAPPAATTPLGSRRRVRKSSPKQERTKPAASFTALQGQAAGLESYNMLAPINRMVTMQAGLSPMVQMQSSLNPYNMAPMQHYTTPYNANVGMLPGLNHYSCIAPMQQCDPMFSDSWFPGDGFNF